MLTGRSRRSRWRAVLLLSGSFVAQAVSAGPGWKPDKHPNPEKILDQAEEDTCAGRYADALAKHVWFHENALKYAPAMYGVRLSFALTAWAELACLYQPALEQLRSVRDKAGQDAREGKDARRAFHDFAAINRTLDEDVKTKDAFVWLDANAASVATEVFDIARPSLVRAKEYRLCGKYLEPDRSFQRALRIYREELRIYREEKGMHLDPEEQVQMQDHARQSFSNSVATLVALLVQNSRREDAKRIAAEATKELTDETFRQDLTKALDGEVPVPWP